MPELSIEYHWCCESLKGWGTKVKSSDGTKEYVVTWGKLFSTGYDYSCSCVGWRFNKKCKHIEEAKEKHCQWQQLFDGGAPTEDKKCPECGDDVFSQGYGV